MTKSLKTMRSIMCRSLLMGISIFLFNGALQAQFFTKSIGVNLKSNEGRVMIPSSDGNFFVATKYDSQVGVAKVDPQGNVLWSTGIEISPDASTSVMDIKEHSNGDQLAGCGFIYDAASGMRNGFVFAIDISGTTPSADWVYLENSTSHGGIVFYGINQYDDDWVISGSYRSSSSAMNQGLVFKIDDAGSVLTSNGYRIYQQTANQEKEYVYGQISGDHLYAGGRLTIGGHSSSGKYRPYLNMIDLTSSTLSITDSYHYLWGANDTEIQYGSALDIVDNDFAILTWGYRDADLDVQDLFHLVVGELDHNGTNIQSTKSIGITINDMEFVMTGDVEIADDGWVLSGYGGDTNAIGTYDIFMIKINHKYELEWARKTGGTYYDRMASYSGGEMYVDNTNGLVYQMAGTQPGIGSQWKTLFHKTTLSKWAYDDCHEDLDVTVEAFDEHNGEESWTENWYGQDDDLITSPTELTVNMTDDLDCGCDEPIATQSSSRYQSDPMENVTSAPAISTNELASIKVFPNPTTHTVTVRLEDSDIIIDRVEVSNLSGQTVRTIRNLGQGDQIIDLTDVEHGLYLINVFTKEQTRHVAKVIVN